MRKIIAIRVTKDYNYGGWTGLYSVQGQWASDLNWHNLGAFYNDEQTAEYYAVCLGELGSIPVYDIGGYEIA